MIGKKIMAGEPIYQFSTGDCVRWSRRQNIGTIEDITEQIVKVFNSKNPKGYQYYELKRSDFDKWVSEKLYMLK